MKWSWTEFTDIKSSLQPKIYAEMMTIRWQRLPEPNFPAAEWISIEDMEVAS